VAFFDLMLIPFYFLIGQWGGPDRVRATIKLVIYTMVGSFLMLAAAIATGVIGAGSLGGHLNFTFSALSHVHLSHSSQDWLFLCFAAAFLVKMPLVPFHGWLRDAYKAMPIPVVAVFSGILSKVAAYGFLRIVLPLFPYATRHYQLLMLLICLVSIVWATRWPSRCGTPAWWSPIQHRPARLHHPGHLLLRPDGGQGALLQMVNHGLVTAGAFFVVAALGLAAAEREPGRHGRRRFPRARFWLAVPDHRPGHAGHRPARPTHRGVMILLGVFQSTTATAVIRVHRRGRCVVLRAAAVHRLECTTGWDAVASREIVRRRAGRRGAVWALIWPWPFFPQFGLSRSSARSRKRSSGELREPSGSRVAAAPASNLGRGGTGR